jgi:hypothetical protein
VTVSLISASAGVWMGSVAFAGHLAGPLSTMSRLIAVLSAALLLYPFEATVVGSLIKLFGVGLSAVMAWREFRLSPEAR